MFKVNSKKQAKIWWLVGGWGGWGVLLLQVVLGGSWVVSDSFCWLRMILGGFRWFAVLVITPILQHTEKLILYYAQSRTWLTERNNKEKIIVAFSPSSLKIGDYFLCYIVFYVR